MKKLLMAALIGTMAFSITGCKGEEKEVHDISINVNEESEEAGTALMLLMMLLKTRVLTQRQLLIHFYRKSAIQISYQLLILIQRRCFLTLLM